VVEPQGDLGDVADSPSQEMPPMPAMPANLTALPPRTPPGPDRRFSYIPPGGDRVGFSNPTIDGRRARDFEDPPTEESARSRLGSSLSGGSTGDTAAVFGRTTYDREDKRPSRRHRLSV
jgi:hypothetical protein